MKLNRLLLIIGAILLFLFSSCFSAQNGGYKHKSRSKKRCNCYTYTQSPASETLQVQKY